MSTKTKSLVFGYIRTNYDLYVPDVILQACLLYFDPEIIIKFTGKHLKELLQLPTGQGFTTKIRFNQYLSFTLEVCPNGKRLRFEPEGFVTFCVFVNMAQNVDYYAINFEISCVETQTLIPIFYKMTQEANNQQKKVSTCSLSPSELKKQKELTFKFTIHSLELKYKNDENKDDVIFYPSLKARLLKQETFLNWNVDTERFSKCVKKQFIFSKVMDNWIFKCCPKGLFDSSDKFCFSICMMSFPLKVSKIVLLITLKIAGDCNYKSSDYETEITLDDYNEGMGDPACVIYHHVEWENIENMTLKATIIMKRLYDMNHNEVAFEKWKDHNVEVSCL